MEHTRLKSTRKGNIAHCKSHLFGQFQLKLIALILHDYFKNPEIRKWLAKMFPANNYICQGHLMGIFIEKATTQDIPSNVSRCDVESSIITSSLMHLLSFFWTILEIALNCMSDVPDVPKRENENICFRNWTAKYRFRFISTRREDQKGL